MWFSLCFIFLCLLNQCVLIYTQPDRLLCTLCPQTHLSNAKLAQSCSRLTHLWRTQCWCPCSPTRSDRSYGVWRTVYPTDTRKSVQPTIHLEVQPKHRCTGRCRWCHWRQNNHRCHWQQNNHRCHWQQDNHRCHWQQNSKNEPTDSCLRCRTVCLRCFGDLCFELLWNNCERVIRPEMTLCGWRDVKIVHKLTVPKN